MTLVAGVDSSTQSTKIVVCDASDGTVVRQASAPHPAGTEVDPEAWWTAYLQASQSGLLDGVSALSVAGQQHGMITLDEDNAVVRPALLWNDTRSAAAAGDLINELGGRDRWTEAVQVSPVASLTITKLRWLAEHEPENARITRSVVLPHDWLTQRVLGTRALVTDRGDASGTGYWSAATGTYREDLLSLAFGRLLEVPTVLAPDQPAGHTPEGLLVAAGTGDNMGAALGLDLAAGDIVVSLGTSGTAFAVHNQPTADPSGTVTGFADATGRFLPLVATLNAARVLTATAALLGTDLAGLDDLAAQAKSQSGLVFLPYLDGERTPDLPGATGSLTGLTRENMTPEQLARAAVEGMLCGLADAVEALTSQGVPLRRLLLIGGAARSAAVQALAPALFGVPVVVPEPQEYVALGAAAQAAWALSGQRLVWPSRPVRTLEPRAADLAAALDIRSAYRQARDRVIAQG